MKNNLVTISRNDYLKSIFSSKRLLVLGFIFLIFLCAVISYGRAFDYYFWRDETKVVWMQRYVPALINNFNTLGTARGRFGSVIFDYFEYAIFGFESFPHQTFGFVLRLINIIILYFFTKILTGQKRTALVSALFYSAFIGGLESYSWVRGIGFMISLSLISFILYVKSFYTSKKRYLILAIVTVVLAFSMDLWRTMGIIFIILLWELLHLIAKDAKLSKKTSFLRLFVFSISLIATIKLMFIGIGSAGGSVTGSASGYIKMALSFETYQHFLISIGNLIRIPFLFAPEEGGIANGDVVSLILGATLLLILVGIFLIFIKRRNISYIPWIVLLTWIFIFYGPNWLYAQVTEVGSTHRYVAFSAVAVPVLWAKYITTKLSAKVATIAIIAFVFFSLIHAVWVVNHDYSVRGRDFFLPYWNTIINSTPPGESNSILSITGNNRIIGYVFAWSDVFPYGTLKGIKTPWQLPIYADTKSASIAICDPMAQVHDPINGETVPAGNKFSIGKAHAWIIPYETLIETTDVFRIETAKLAKCLWKDDLALIPLKQTKNSYALLSSWKKPAQEKTFYYSVLITTNRQDAPVDKKTGKVTFDSEQSEAISVVDIEFDINKRNTYILQISIDDKVVRKISLNDLLLLSIPELRK